SRLGAPAEVGQFSWVVFHSVTKSRANDFSGEAEFFYTGKGLTATSSEFPDLSATIENHTEGNLQFGGPIRKDKLWYYGAAQYIRDPKSEGGPIETEKNPTMFFKLSSLATSKRTT